MFAGIVLLPSCQEIINYPAPTIVALEPNNCTAGTTPFILKVTGYSLTPATTIEWNNIPLVQYEIFVSQNVMTATIPASLVQNPGQVPVFLQTPQPGGGTSQTLTFTINPAQSAIPAITSLDPSAVLAGGGGTSLIVNGNNFGPLATVTVNGSNRPTSFRGLTQLVASLNSSDIATAGEVSIAVINPPPGGGTSNLVNLTVTNPVPAIASITPAGALAGATPPTLSIAGSSFVPNSYVTINGQQRPTTFSGGGSVAVTLTTADLAVGGINQVEVVNPPPGGGPSNLVLFPVNPTTNVGLPVLLDLDPNGNPAINGVCGSVCSTGIPTLETAGPSISSNGQFVLFASTSNNLLLSQSANTSSIFYRSTCLGEGATCTPKTFIVSLTFSGGTANGPSWEPTIDSGGSHLAYTSEATNIVATTTVPSGVSQIYWSPICTTTATSCFTQNGPGPTLVSVAADGVTPGNGPSYNPVVSPDGQYVAFVSLATNLIPNIVFDGTTPQVFIRATCNGVAMNGCLPVTYLVSSPNLLTPGNGSSLNPAISNDGLYVSFTSTATNLGATAPNPGGGQQVFTRSTCVTTLAESTNTCTPITYLTSTPDGVTPANGTNLDSTISSDGRFIAFASNASNLGTVSDGVQEIYVRDTCTGVTLTTCTPAIYLISTPDGTTPANGLSEHPSINSCGGSGTTCTTGEEFGFASLASNLGLNVSNSVENVFVRNACLVVVSSINCVTGTTLASQAAGTSPPPSNGNSIMPVISGDGHSIAFISTANNLVPYPTSGFQDVYLAPTHF